MCERERERGDFGGCEIGLKRRVNLIKLLQIVFKRSEVSSYKFVMRSSGNGKLLAWAE